MMSKLSPRQERFVAEYVATLNATKSAIAAGYSKKTAEQQGSRLLSNVKVQEALSKARGKVQKRLEWTADDIIRGIREIAENKEARDADRLKGYELGGKYLGMWTDKLEANVTGAMTVVFDKSMEDDE